MDNSMEVKLERSKYLSYFALLYETKSFKSHLLLFSLKLNKFPP